MKTYYISLFTLFLMIFGLPVVSFSQSAVKDTLDLAEVVITATKQETSIGNVTQKIDVIPSLAIKSLVLGNNNIAEALQYLPGASVSALSRNDANWGTYGGIGPKYSTYMLSGLPVDAFVDPQSLDLAALDRIEVQRGPASVLYPNWLSQDFAGNQSPLSGTVNLVLKEKFDQQKTIISSAYGSYNTFNGQVYHQDFIRHLHYFAGMTFEMSDYTNYGTENSWLNMQDNPQYRKTKVFAGANWFTGRNENQKFSFFINRTFHNGDAGRVYRGFDNDYTTINAGYSVVLNKKISLNTHFGMRIYDRKWQESQFNIVDSLISNNGAYQNIVPADVNLTYSHGKANLLTVGVDYQGADYYTWSDPLLGYRQYGNKSTAFQSGVYAQEELRFGGLILRAGLRYNYVRNNIELISGGAPGEKEKSWSSFLWSGGVKYHIGSTASVFANAGNSFLTPGLKSVGGTILLSDLGVPGKNGQLPNPDLKPESGMGVDVGANLTLPSNLSASIRGFYLAVDDAIVDIVVSENPSQSQSVNAGKSTSIGIEVELNHHLNDLFSWFANYTWMKTNIENPYFEDQNDVNVPFAPEHVANAGIDLSFPFGLKFSPYLNYNGGYYDSNSKSGRKKFTPGALVNAFISQSLTNTDTFNLELFARFYNLTNNRYEMPWQFQNTGFSVMAGLTMTLN
jgi:iron complex outermembrane recepter protein